ncbi:MAG: AAA family ATPase [Myxococcota bacterium]
MLFGSKRRDTCRCGTPFELTKQAGTHIEHGASVVVTVHGAPSLRCPACGADERVAIRLAHAVQDALVASRAEATFPGLLDALEHVGSVDVRVAPDTLGSSPVANPAEDQLEEIAPDRALEELVLPDQVRETVEILLAQLRDPELAERILGSRLGGRARRGRLLLVGPPGTGKTTLGAGLGRRLGRPTLRLRAGDALDRHLGATEKRLTAAFSEARRRGAILFIDEADSLFSHRVQDGTAQGQTQNDFRNHLLQELDAHEGIVVLATNFPDAIDHAVRSRFPATVALPAPDALMRRALWAAALRGTRVEPEPDAAWINRLDQLVEEHERVRGDARCPFGARAIDEVLRSAFGRAALRGPMDAILRLDFQRALEQTLAMRAERASIRPEEQARVAGNVVGIVADGLRAGAVQLAREIASARGTRPQVGDRDYVPRAEATMAILRGALELELRDREALARALAGLNLQRPLDEQAIRGMLAHLKGQPSPAEAK